MPITIPATGPGTIIPIVATESHGVAGHFQLIKLIDGSVGSLSPVGTSANPLNITQPALQNIVGSIGVTQLGGVWAMGGEIAHDVADSGNPVKIGGYAATSAFPSAVASGDRVNALFDRTGRIVTANWAPLAMGQSKHNDFTGPLSGTVVWSGGVNSRICVTDVRIIAGSATPGIATLYFARSGAPINFTVASGVCVFRGEMAPSATVKPGAVMQFGYPVAGDPNDSLRISLTTTMQVYVQVGGFEAP